MTSIKKAVLTVGMTLTLGFGLIKPTTVQADSLDLGQVSDRIQQVIQKNKGKSYSEIEAEIENEVNKLNVEEVANQINVNGEQLNQHMTQALDELGKYIENNMENDSLPSNPLNVAKIMMGATTAEEIKQVETQKQAEKNVLAEMSTAEKVSYQANKMFDGEPRKAFKNATLSMFSRGGLASLDDSTYKQAGYAKIIILVAVAFVLLVFGNILRFKSSRKYRY